MCALQAPAMAGSGVFTVTDNDLFDYLPENNAGKDDEGCVLSAKGSNFVFNLDQSLLIDASCVVIGQVLGEGPQSIVYEGLWDPL